MTEWADSMGEKPLEHNAKMFDCIMFLRELALFLYDNSPRSEREMVSVLTVALARSADILESAHEVITSMSEEMRNTLQKGVFDEDGYLEVLAKWKEYEKGT